MTPTEKTAEPTRAQRSIRRDKRARGRGRAAFGRTTFGRTASARTGLLGATVGLALAALVAAGCTVPPEVTQTVPECAWEVAVIGSQSGPDTPTNILFPDTNSNYWLAAVPLAESTTVTVSGAEIDARYWSLQTYTAQDLFSSTIDSLRDDQVTTAADGSWSITVTPTGDAGTNPLRALEDGTPSGTTWLMFRTYLPDDPSMPAGSLGLPTVEIADEWGTRVVEPCTHPSSTPPATPASTDGSAPEWLETPELAFKRPQPTFTPFPNADAAYLAAPATRRAGEVVVIRAKAPSFPEADVSPIGSGADLRYWSWCQFGLPSTKTVACVADQDVPLDAEGWYTVVISDPADRPTNATAADGVAWLPWGREPVAAFALRNLVPDPSFDEAAQAVPVSGTATTTHMGDHTPLATFCARSTFEAEGHEGCFSNAQPAL